MIYVQFLTNSLKSTSDAVLCYTFPFTIYKNIFANEPICVESCSASNPTINPWSDSAAYTVLSQVKCYSTKLA